MKNYIDCDNVYIDKCVYGLGVFSLKDFKEGDIIEIGLMSIVNNVDGNENDHLFTWSDDRTIWACGSGCLPYYNHSNEPNIKKVGDLINNTMKIVALKDIMGGDELMNKYISSSWRKCFKTI